MAVSKMVVTEQRDWRSNIGGHEEWWKQYVRSSMNVINFFFFFNDTATTEIYTLSLHDALPISPKSFDAWALEVMAELVTEVRETVNPELKAFAFVKIGRAHV